MRREKGSEHDEGNSDDEEADEVLAQVIEGLKLEDHEPNEDEEEFKEEEYPWCIICNEDAVLICRECDGEIFCRRCFKECHMDADIRCHSGEPYNPKK